MVVHSVDVLIKVERVVQLRDWSLAVSRLVIINFIVSLRVNCTVRVVICHMRHGDGHILKLYDIAVTHFSKGLIFGIKMTVIRIKVRHIVQYLRIQMLVHKASLSF